MKTQTTDTIMYPNPDHEALAPDNVMLLTPDKGTLSVSNDDTMKLISMGSQPFYINLSALELLHTFSLVIHS